MRAKSRPAPRLDEEAARERCLRLLEKRARAAAELRERLSQAGFARDVIETVLTNLTQAGLVDDEEFARLWVAQRTAGGAGRHKLRWELGRKGVHADVIRRLVDEAIDDDTELQQALDLARCRLRGRPAEAPILLRLRRFLLRRGYGFGTVEGVIRRLASQEDLSDAG